MVYLATEHATKGQLQTFTDYDLFFDNLMALIYIHVKKSNCNNWGHHNCDSLPEQVIMGLDNSTSGIWSVL